MRRRHATHDDRVAAAAAAAPLTTNERMLAGAIARGVSQTMLHPVDVIRTRVQARNVARMWGPGVFAKGIAPQFFLSLPAGAIQFTSFEWAQDQLRAAMPGGALAGLRTLLAGAFGAAVAASCRVPQELLKQRVQADVYPNAVAALRQTVARDGVRGLYAGWSATLTRDIPWNALSFAFHASAKSVFRSATGREPRNDENLALAGVAGAGAALLTMPIDVVKTRLMTQAAGAPAKYAGIVPTFATIVREEGARTLMKGLLPRVIYLAPLAGVTFSVYEGVAKVIQKRKLAKASELMANAAAAAPAPVSRNVVFASAPVKRAAPSRSRIAAVTSEADALVYLAAYELPRMPYFVSTI